MGQDEYMEVVWPHGKIIKEMYVSQFKGSSLRGRSLGKWMVKVKEYICEGIKGRGGWAWMDNESLLGEVEVEDVLCGHSLFIILSCLKVWKSALCMHAHFYSIKLLVWSAKYKSEVPCKY